jgi:acetoacetate decarboxylase
MTALKMNLKIKKEKYYSMPVMPYEQSSWPFWSQGTTTYHDVLTLSVGYLTDKEKIERLLPEPYEVGQQPTVSVFFQCCKDVDWLGGGRYNLVGVNVSVTFKGKRDIVTGNYCIVMWENLMEPIIMGREGLGVPKIPAQIPDPVQIGSAWHAHAERHGLVFLEMDITDVRPVDAKTMGEGFKTPWMGWKYIPRIDGPGADVSYPTLIESGGTVKEAWVGNGALKLRKTSPKLDATQAHIINAIAELKIKEYLWATITRGSITLGAEKKGKKIGGKRLE